MHFVAGHRLHSRQGPTTTTTTTYSSPLKRACHRSDRVGVVDHRLVVERLAAAVRTVGVGAAHHHHEALIHLQVVRVAGNLHVVTVADS